MEEGFSRTGIRECKAQQFANIVLYHPGWEIHRLDVFIYIPTAIFASSELPWSSNHGCESFLERFCQSIQVTIGLGGLLFAQAFIHLYGTQSSNCHALSINGVECIDRITKNKQAFQIARELLIVTQAILASSKAPDLCQRCSIFDRLIDLLIRQGLSR